MQTETFFNIFIRRMIFLKYFIQPFIDFILLSDSVFSKKNCDQLAYIEHII